MNREGNLGWWLKLAQFKNLPKFWGEIETFLKPRVVIWDSVWDVKLRNVRNLQLIVGRKSLPSRNLFIGLGPELSFFVY